MSERKIGMCRPETNNKNLVECLKNFEVVDMRNLTEKTEIKFIKDRRDVNMEKEYCKRECYWNCDGQCCPEDEESFNNAKPNNEECTTFLRKDFDDYFWDTYDYILGSIQKMNLEQLEKVKEFIESNSKEDK
jgi:hypothetical protein